MLSCANFRALEGDGLGEDHDPYELKSPKEKRKSLAGFGLKPLEVLLVHFDVQRAGKIKRLSLKWCHRWLMPSLLFLNIRFQKVPNDATH
jgi:hypothetical protein